MNNTLSMLTNLPYFKTSNIKALLPLLKTESIYRKLNRWHKKGVIIRLKKGFYVSKEYHKKHGTDLHYLYYLANVLRYPSYVSSTFVLQNNGILTDVTFPVTSMTTKTTRKYYSKMDNFFYYSISPRLYIGYERLLYNDEPIYVATLAKALFDYIYIKYFKVRIRPEAIIKRERLNLDEFSKKDITEFKKYCTLSRNKILIELVPKLFTPLEDRRSA
ncbi:hypothetical protein MYX07_04170 [Patescibacteria group bacterium AH-259-L07]|nr:hypothetical protein [Patescibacteria group bacterium AH-259-L07]